MTTLAEAAQARKERLLFDEIDSRIDLLLSNLAESPGDHYHAVTANARSMAYLHPLLRYYGRQPHIWTKCMADNFKRFGPKAKGLCAVIKDTVRQNAMWRHGAPRGPHPLHPDAGTPGVAIASADKAALHHLSEDRPLSLIDALDMEFGVVDHTEPLTEALKILIALGEQCDIYRVLIGLDEPPVLDLAEVLA